MKKNFKFVASSLLFLLLSSCSKYSEITFKDTSFIIKPDNVKVSKIKEVSWNVGPLRRQRLSKGFSVDINFPVLNRKSMERLITEYGIDAWIIKVNKRAFSVNNTIGMIYIPLVVPGTQGRNKFRRHQIKKGVFSVYYPAAAVSKRLELLACPAFEHDRYLTDLNIEKTTSLIDSFSSSSLENVFVPGRVEEFGYNSNVINGGARLEGEYTFEIALYNQKEKRRKSNFVELGESAIVAGEKQRNISGCEGSVVPPKGEDVDKLKLFKWQK